MADFQKPIERFENKDWSIPPVQKIEKDRKKRDEARSPEGKENSIYSLLCAALISECKKFLSLFSSKEKIQAALVDPAQVADHLHSFKKLLQQLSREDVSRDRLFTRQFSEIWQRLVQDLHRIEAFEKDKPNIGPKLKKLLETVGSFPPAADHPLGYYLTQHAGEEWLPFPFMDILSLLHKENQESMFSRLRKVEEQKAKQSVLTSWLALIQDALSAIES